MTHGVMISSAGGLALKGDPQLSSTVSILPSGKSACCSLANMTPVEIPAQALELLTLSTVKSLIYQPAFRCL